MRVFRNIVRRRSRSLLTTFGVAVGVFAVVVLGALAERNNVMISAGLRYKEHRVTVVEEKNVNAYGMVSPNRLLSIEVADEIRRVPGVRRIVPQVMLPLDFEEGIPIGQPQMIAGGFMGRDMRGEWRFAKGEPFSETERGVAVVGSDLVRRVDAKPGKKLELRGRSFTIVGILDTTLSGLDASVFVPLAEAQEMYRESLPESFQKTVKAEDLAVAMTVYPQPGQDADAIAARLNKQVKGVAASGPAAWQKQANGLSAMLEAVAFFVGAIALFAGGLLVVNAMMMSVAERTREVGVERAMGASTARVARQFLCEALTIGVLGGLSGLAAGALAVCAITAGLAESGLVLFALTPRLALLAMIFSVMLSGLAGLYPAWHAARLNPVAALAYE